MLLEGTEFMGRKLMRQVDSEGLVKESFTCKIYLIEDKPLLHYARGEFEQS